MKIKGFNQISIMFFVLMTVSSCKENINVEIYNSKKKNDSIVKIPNSISLKSPSTSPSTDNSPTITVTGVSNSLTVKLFTDSNCTNEVASGLATATSIDLTTQALSVGTYTFYSNTTNAAGNVSACSSAIASYEVLSSGPSAPSAPTSLSLQTPASSPSTDTTPTITVSGVSNGDTVAIFSNNSCTASVGTGVSTGTSINITLSALAVGAYTLYANTTNTSSLTSLCSTANVAYTVTASTFNTSFITIPVNKTGFTGLPTDLIRSVVFDSSDRMYLMTDLGISYSTDSGVTFTNHTNSDGLPTMSSTTTRRLSYNSTNGTLFSTYYNNVVKTTNSGTSYSTFNISTLGASWINGIYARGAGLVCVATNAGVALSTDNGATFSLKNVANGLLTPSTNDCVIDSSGKIYVAQSSGVAISSDGGTTFTTKTNMHGLAATNSTSIAIDTLDNVYVTSSLGLSKTSDGGSTFSSFGTGNGLASNSVTRVFTDASNNVYVIYFSAPGIAISTNGGTNFVSRTTAHCLPTNAIYGISVNSLGHIYVATGLGLSYSTNGGTSFTNIRNSQTLQKTSLYTTGEVFVDSSENIYIAFDGGYAFSTNQGLSFTTKTTADGLINAYGTAIFKDASGTIYYGSLGGLSITSDNGATFLNKTTSSGLGSNNITAISKIEGANKLLVGTALGLFQSTNGGTSFTSAGIPGININEIYIHGTTVYASTNSGLYVSTDNCATWIVRGAANGLATSTVYSTRVLSNGAIYAVNGVSVSMTTNINVNFSLVSNTLNPLNLAVDSNDNLCVGSTSTGINCIVGGIGLLDSTNNFLSDAISGKVYMSPVSSTIFARTNYGISTNMNP